jgi:hypothetical protein
MVAGCCPPHAQSPHVTVWTEVALLPPLVVGSVGLDIARRAYLLPADG